jgi:transposase
MDFLPIHKDQETLVILGIDTHADVHVAVALDGHGRRLGHKKSVPSTEAGYAALVAWVEEFGTLERAGIEGSGSFGVGLARFLRARGVEVVEVNRPNRQHRRRFGKHDTADAEAAARALQANTATGEPKSADGPAEMVRTLHVVRRSALKARTQAANQLRALLLTAPEELRAQLRGLSTAKLVATAACFRPGCFPDDVRSATKLAMRTVARRHRWLSEEIVELDEQIGRLVSEAVCQPSSRSGAWVPTRRLLCWLPSQTIRRGSRARRPSPACAAWLRCRPPRARQCATASTVEVTETPPLGAARAGAREDELGRTHPRVRR